MESYLDSDSNSDNAASSVVGDMAGSVHGCSLSAIDNWIPKCSFIFV